jgi:hypothetical protein
MNKQLKNNQYTFIVQAEKICYIYPDGENLLKPIKAHYFRTLQEVEKFLNHYLDVIRKDPLIVSLDVMSKHSIETEMPYIITWRR